MPVGIYVGTSGWVYHDWRGKFYPDDLPQKKWLEYFGQHFKTVEINSTFYHQMKAQTFENWAKTVPSDFIFSVKVSRFITHIKRLKTPESSINTFLKSTSYLGSKLGPILFQCPPRWKADAKRLESFLSTVHRLQLNPDTVSSHSDTVSERPHLAFEFRDPSWFDPKIYQILKKYNAALVIAESGGHWPTEEVLTADFTYIRFHGEGGSYASKYTDDELNVWGQKIKKWQKSGTDVYAYFNNDVAGFALENAKTLLNLLQ